MNNSSYLDDNQKILVDAFKLQNEEAYDQALEKLQQAGGNLIKIIEKIQSSSEFYMRHMQLMKQERDLVSEKDYKEFIAKNEKILSRNFEKNAYLALLMQQIQQKESLSQTKKWTNKQEDLMKKMILENRPMEEIQQRLNKHRKEDVKIFFEIVLNSIKKEENQRNIMGMP